MIIKWMDGTVVGHRKGERICEDMACVEWVHVHQFFKKIYQIWF